MSSVLSKALRLPAPNTASLIYSLCRSYFASPRSLPHGGDFRTGPVPFKPRHHRLFRSRSYAGSPRFLENPSHTSAPL